MRSIIIVFLLSISAFSQSQQHGVQLSWTYSDPLFPTVTFNVYRLSAACPTGPPSGFTKLTATPVSVDTYFDSSPGTNGTIDCYYLTAVGNGLESAPSPTAQVTFQPPPFSPPAPTTTVK